MNKFNIEKEVVIRELRDDDMNFVYNTWLKSYRNSTFAKSIENDVYFEMHKKVIDSCIKAGEVKILCSPEDSDHLFGYICATDLPTALVIHYVYIKYNFRKFGLAELLVKSFGDKPLVLSHLPKNLRRLESRFSNVKYNPYFY